VGQYNTAHAWEMDQVIEEAERQGIRLNFVVHNHGKFSSFSDSEWDTNPFNDANGGWLSSPDEFFTDARSMRESRKLMRYILARWSYSSSVFAWELFSELDLTGSQHQTYRRQAVTDWHQAMGRAVKELDPNDHLIGSHVCQDYHHQNSELISLPEMDFCPIDAYHSESSPLYIVSLLRETAAFNNPFGKPVLVTEFGGSPFAAGLNHLRDTLHAGLWGSAVVPLGGTPMFWWWGLIDEENMYREYAGLAAFLQGEDRRRPDQLMDRPSVTGEGVHAGQLSAHTLQNRRGGYGWLYEEAIFDRTDPLGAPAVSNVTVTLSGLEDGVLAVEFWDTTRGVPVEKSKAEVKGGSVTLRVPPFPRDIAFKYKRPAP
jgi:hypothetical protein